MSDRVDAGRIAGVHGLRGELKFDLTRAGADALAPGVVYDAVLRDGSARALRVVAIREHKGRPLVRVDGVEDATAAEALHGAALQVARDDVPLGDGEYFDDQLVGCALVDPAGRIVGTVVAVEHLPASDALVVGERRALVPLVRAFIRGVDVAAKQIAVDLPAGLLDDREAETG